MVILLQYGYLLSLAVCHLFMLFGLKSSTVTNSYIFFILDRSAKERKVRIWKDYVAPTANLDQKDKQFVAKVRFLSGFYF